MDQDHTQPVGGGWMRRHHRAVAASILFLGSLPALLFCAAALWITGSAYPGVAMAAGLALVWVAVRVRRRRLRA